MDKETQREHCCCFTGHRPEWMVSHSALVIAAFNGGSGGTRNTLDFARKQRVPCVIIDIGIKL